MTIIDKEQNDILQSWFNEIRGVRFLSSGCCISYENFLEHFNYDQHKYFSESGYIFIKTTAEEINVFTSIVIERTSEELYVPTLKLVSFKDGRPPARVFMKAY